MPRERLDARLARETGLSRSQVEKLIEDGCASVDERPETRPGRKVDEGSTVSLRVPPQASLEPKAEPIPLCIVYQDDHIAVIDKPTGLVVHPGAGNASGTLVNALLHHMDRLSAVGESFRPGIVHRLDKDTSGLLLIAKSDLAHEKLAEALKARTIQKTYQAVIQGQLKQESGAIEAPIARHPTDRKRMAISETGRYARTEYQLAQALRGASLLHVLLVTGRTHQIRVHFASVGHPILGDPLYGGKNYAKSASRLMLHAWKLQLNHPVTGEPLCFTADPPESFSRAIAKILP